MDRGGHRPELDHFRAELGDEAAVGCAARGADVGRRTSDFADRGAQGLDQLAARREIRRAGERPFEFVIEPVTIEHGANALLELVGRARRGKAEIEHHLDLARDDVGRPGAAVDIGDLPGGRRKVFVAPVPLGRGELGERGGGEMNGVFRQMRIRDVALHALDAQRA